MEQNYIIVKFNKQELTRWVFYVDKIKLEIKLCKNFFLQLFILTRAMNRMLNIGLKWLNM